MKVLIIQPVNRKNGVTGGTYGSKRIVDIVKNIYGNENVDVYELPYYPSKIKAFFYNFFLYSDGLTKNTIKDLKLTVDSYDILFLNTTKLGKIAKFFYSNKIIFSFAHNNESDFVKQYLRSMSFVKKVIHLPLFFSVVYNEKKSVKYSNCLFCLNERDSQTFYEKYSRKADFLIPMTFYDKFDSLKRDKYNKTKNKFLLFVGSDFYGNTEGLFWFIENILDFINIKLLVIGSGMDKYSQKYIDKNVEFIGFVEDIDKYYYSCEAIVLPIVSGSGMKTKTCECLMYGKYIFGTTEAFEGYNLNFEKVGALCNTSEEFINSLKIIFNNNFDKNNTYSRDVFLKNYETKTILAKLKKFLLSKEYI